MMSIAADFTIDTDNRILKHTTGITVYTVNDLYSYIQDYFDEITTMTITVPMSAQTPTEYSLINGWFIPEDTFKYLKTGAVKTFGWDTGSFADGVMIMTLSVSGYIDCQVTDIGKVVSDGAHTGILLDYDNSLMKWWVRKTAGTTTGSITISDGAGAGTISTLVTGESLFSNVYTLGSIDPAITNTLYVEQTNPSLINNQIAQYWPSGHIDIIIKVREGSVLIDSGLVRIYCREYTDLYSHFAIDLSGGGRNPVPLGTASDSNNQTAPGTVSGWNDVTVTFGSITRDLHNGAGPQPYECEIDCGSRVSLSQVYERLKLLTSRNSGYTLQSKPGQFYRSTNSSYNENTGAPFGSYAGGQFFGERGIWLKNVPLVDVNNFKLVDSNNVSRIPPFLSGITLTFNANLSADGAKARYCLFFKQINVNGVSSSYGTNDAVLVKKADGISEVIGDLTGNISSVTLDFDYDGNSQCAWTPLTPYSIGDFYRAGTTWYRVVTGYISGSTFGSSDTTNGVTVTGPDVVMTSVGLTTGQFVKSTGTITRSVSNIISAISSLELNYAN